MAATTTISAGGRRHWKDGFVSERLLSSDAGWPMDHTLWNVGYGHTRGTPCSIAFQAKPRSEALENFSDSPIGPSNTRSRAEQAAQECSVSNSRTTRMRDYHKLLRFFTKGDLPDSSSLISFSRVIQPHVRWHTKLRLLFVIDRTAIDSLSYSYNDDHRWGHRWGRHGYANTYQAMRDNPRSRNGGIDAITLERYPPRQPLFLPDALAYILL
ncbi:hypothetical protein EDD85DRAFT_250883 [Armillaria nabsnona]|nr:hypothetical protein EDD85DRAFT_250883 [Armillaria nabsnona]